MSVKRFYRHVEVAKTARGYEVKLDGRAVRTLGRRPMDIPSEPFAHAVAGEWRDQGEEIDRISMRLTCVATAAIDLVAGQRAEVETWLAGYAASDLLCHHATHPTELAARQKARWLPILSWLAKRYGAHLDARPQILPIAQPSRSLARLRQVVSGYDDFSLAALRAITFQSGSLVLALAVAEDRVDADTLWSLCQLDEDFQAETWGRDAEYERRRKDMKRTIQAAARVLAWCRSAG